ncbi:MAG: TetR/AcrR family transcriptional regulator [Hyphomicrobiaceae bacterium]|nr:TetR/AcrR family transcriptional regulator [Hyphomicrobiaceae bacterium]MCC0025032.1 TetR/AcrR family transcriptional regulator [Hyphomicrobiaceae bacterium]
MSGRDALLQTGFQLFLAHGFDGTGINEILAATGLSKGAFYHHFTSKQVLYEEVIATFFPSPFDQMDWDAQARLPSTEQKQAILDFYRQLVASGEAVEADLTRYYALFFDSLSRLPRFSDEINLVYRRAISALAEALEQEGATAEQATAEARRFIAEQEGALYLAAVAGLSLN